MAKENIVEVPQTLYRGYKVKFKRLKDFHLSGVNLKVNYDPLINENGEKIVTDGNEYGVYMSDNLTMVKDAYGNARIPSENVEPIVTLNNGQYLETLTLPVIAIIYEINTTGLDIRKPKISSTLKGHYNNGYAGDEFIADEIPADHYHVIRVKIGSDLLHDGEEIDLADIEKAEKELKTKAELRKYRLELLANSLTNLPKNKRFDLKGSDKEIFRAIFGENGIRYINPNQLNFNSNDDIIKWLYYNIFNKTGLMDMKSLKLVNELQKKLNENLNIIDIINQELANLQTKNKIFFKQKGYDNPVIIEKIEIFENFKRLINFKRKPYINSEVIASIKDKDSNKEEMIPTSSTKEQLLFQKDIIIKEKQKRKNEEELKLQQENAKHQQIQEEIIEEEQGLSM